MAKTYNTLGTVAPGDVLRANSGTASYNGLITNVNNYRVPPMCRVQKSGGTQPISAGTYIAWNNASAQIETDLTDPMWSSGSDTRLTVKTAGVYQVTWNFGVGWTGNAYGANFQITKTTSGGSESAESDWYVYHASLAFQFGLNGSITALVSANAGDYFRAKILQVNGGSSWFHGVSNAFNFSAAWLGQVS